MGEQIVGRGIENGEWTILGPDGSNTHTVDMGTLSFTPTEFGVYAIQSPDGVTVHTVAVSLTSKLESTPSNSLKNTLESTLTPEEILGESSQYQRWIWLFLLGLLIINWRVNR